MNSYKPTGSKIGFSPASIALIAGVFLMMGCASRSVDPPVGDGDVTASNSGGPSTASDTARAAVGITPANWLEPENIPVAFRSMEHLVPTRTVSPARRPLRLRESRDSLDGLTYEFAGENFGIADFGARTGTTGLLVLHGDEILHEEYLQGATESSKLLSMSMAKSFTATLLGIARAEGKIASFDDPVTKYLPELEGTGYDGVAIKHILQMSSGVDFTEDYADGEADIARLGAACFGGPERVEEVAMTYGRKAEPGSAFAYASVDTAILGWLLRKVTDKSLSSYMEEKLWKPMGAEASAQWVLDQAGPDGVECALGGFNATVRDYGRFGLLMAQDGMVDGRRVLPAGWVAEATIPDAPAVQPGKLYPEYPLGYQYQWWTFPGPDNSFTAEGIHGQLLMVNPVLDLVVVKTSAWATAWEDDKEAESWALFKALEERLRAKKE